MSTIKDGGHPLDALHINQGSMDAAADAYESEYLRDKIKAALDRLDRAHAGHAVGHDQSDAPKGGHSEGFVRGFGECLRLAKEMLSARDQEQS